MFRPTLLAVAFSLFALAGCAGSEGSGTTHTTTNALTEEVPELAGIQAYGTVTALAGSGSMRVAKAGADFVEAAAVAHEEVPGHVAIGGGASLDFGREGQTTLEVGVYDCAKGEAAVALLGAGPKSLVTHHASRCTLAIETVQTGAETTRITGRFIAPADGTFAGAKGAFIVDVATP